MSFDASFAALTQYDPNKHLLLAKGTESNPGLEQGNKSLYSYFGHFVVFLKNLFTGQKVSFHYEHVATAIYTLICSSTSGVGLQDSLLKMGEVDKDALLTKLANLKEKFGPKASTRMNDATRQQAAVKIQHSIDRIRDILQRNAQGKVSHRAQAGEPLRITSRRRRRQKVGYPHQRTTVSSQSNPQKPTTPPADRDSPSAETHTDQESPPHIPANPQAAKGGYLKPRALGKMDPRVQALRDATIRDAQEGKTSTTTRWKEPTKGAVGKERKAFSFPESDNGSTIVPKKRRDGTRDPLQVPNYYPPQRTTTTQSTDNVKGRNYIEEMYKELKAK